MESLNNAEMFGEMIRNERRRQGLRQQEAADLTGVSVRFLGDLERGKPTCELEKALSVASTLGLRLIVEERI
jgi:y4mF family transcriptional regulator